MQRRLDRQVHLQEAQVSVSCPLDVLSLRIYDYFIVLQCKVVVYFIYSMQAAASAVAAEWSDYMCTLGKSELTRSVSPRDGRCTVQCASVGWRGYSCACAYIHEHMWPMYMYICMYIHYCSNCLY